MISRGSQSNYKVGCFCVKLHLREDQACVDEHFAGAICLDHCNSVDVSRSASETGGAPLAKHPDSQKTVSDRSGREWLL